MKRIAMIIVLAVGTAACDQQPGAAPTAVSPQQPGATTAPSGQDKGVLLASRPAQAKVFLKGAEIGETPLKLLVTEEMNLVLQRDGYVRQAVWVTKDSKTNLIVDLIQSPPNDCCPCDAMAEPEGDVALAAGPPPQKGSGKRSTKKIQQTSATLQKDEGSGKPAPVVQPAVQEPEPPPPEPVVTPAPSKTYSTMRELKTALRTGTIDKTIYRQVQAEIRRKRQLELDAVKKAYRAEKITKDQYKQKVREIKLKYEG